jgi:transcriptional regulator with XRE-family HTH domain
MSTSEAGVGPTARRLIVGAQLRRLREAAGISREDAGYVIRCSASKISRLELGRVGFKDRDVADLLSLYGITDDRQRGPLLMLAREASSPGWWHDYDDVLPNWFQTYVGLEEAASSIRTYEIQFIPGLLQTPDYARAVVVSGLPSAPAGEIERRVTLRLARQRVLTRPDPPTFWAVLDEATLSRPVGGRPVMRAQIQHLLDLLDSPNVTIQVMPLHAGSHAADGGSFSILRFPEPDLPDIVYVEQLVSALYLDKPEHVDRYLQVMERLIVDSLPPDRTADMLAAILKST